MFVATAWTSKRSPRLGFGSPSRFTARILRRSRPQADGPRERSGRREEPAKIQCIGYWLLSTAAVRCRVALKAAKIFGAPQDLGAFAPSGLGIAMLAHCINQNCGELIHSLADGRLFQFEIVSISLSANDDARDSFDEEPYSQTAQFWLCGHCAMSVTLVLEASMGLKILPLADGDPSMARRSPDKPPPSFGKNSC